MACFSTPAGDRNLPPRYEIVAVQIFTKQELRSGSTAKEGFGGLPDSWEIRRHGS